MRNNIGLIKLEYNKSYDTFCFQNCIRYILALHGIDNIDFVINRSMSLIICKRDDEKLIYSYDNNYSGVVGEYSEKIKSFRSNKDCKRLFEEVMENRPKNCEIIMGLDSYELPYLPFYKKSHGLHNLIVKSYDKQNRKVHVMDNISPWNYDGQVDLDDFIRARESKNEYDGGVFSNMPIENVWHEVNYLGWNASMKALVRHQIELTINQYYSDYGKRDIVNGVMAIEYIKQKIERLDSYISNQQENILEDIRMILFKLNHRRIFWTDFLQQTPVEMRSNYFDRYFIRFSELQKEFEKLSFKIIMLKMKKRKKLQVDIVNDLNKIIESEKEIGELLKKHAELKFV